MRIDRRTSLRLFAGAATLLSAPVAWRVARGRDERVARQADIVTAMKRASDFMREHCAVNGGYVWQYAADLSRRWGEMEAFPSMIWLQPPGTATVGHVFLDSFHATGDDYFYEAACEVGEALEAAQHPSGGWNYVYDFAGSDSLRSWYETIGRNGWRLEEFHHFYGNATFDDAGTIEAATLLLRLYLEKHEERWRAPLQRVVDFVLDSQYDNGGWPQRFPFVEDRPVLHGMPDYTRHITFNDDVAGKNIRFLLLLWQTFRDERVAAALRRAMGIFVETLQPAPQAGWGSQHDARTLEPAAARSYEPKALTTHVTAANIAMLLDFYEWTGDERFIDRVPETLDWLASVRLAAGDVRMPGREFPTYVEIGTNRPLYSHRRGSNVVNGAYYQDYDPEKPITHNAQWRLIDLDYLRMRFEAVQAKPLAASPLEPQPGFEVPRYFIGADARTVTAGATIDDLDRRGAWLTPLRMTSNPYIGAGPMTVAPGDFTGSFVGDRYDTSPYFVDTPQHGISTRNFVANMATLVDAAARGNGEAPRESQ